MTVFVVPVGMSLFDNIDNNPWGLRREDLARLDATDRLPDVSGIPRDRGSAELASLAVAGFNPTFDLALLLCSGTPGGVTAGRVIVAVLGLDVPPVESAPNPAISRPVTVVTIPGLDPEDPRRFTDALDGIGGVLSGLRARLDAGERVKFLLSGGFKATVPHLVFLASCFASLAPEQVRATMLWESSAEEMDVPLLTFSVRTVRKELADPEGVTTRMFDGYLYKRYPKFRYTLIGSAVCHLFDVDAKQ